MIDTGVRLLTGQEVSLKTIGSSFVEGCVASAAGSAAAKLVGKAVGAVKNTKTAAKIASATSKVKDKTSSIVAVSYTHLDVYKRQKRTSARLLDKVIGGA